LLARVLVIAAVALATVLLALPAASAEVGGAPILVGFTDDLLKNEGSVAVAPAAGLGARAFRITLMWDRGQTQLDPTEIGDLDRATRAAPGMKIVLSVYAAAGIDAPVDSTARDAYCGFIKNALTRYSSIRDVVIWNEPNKRLFWNPQANAPALYEALLARCFDVLHNAFRHVNVIGLALSSTGNDDSASTSPGAFIRGVGDAMRASGRSKQLFDTVGFHPYSASASERPWRKHIQSKTIGEGDWNKLAYNLWLAFNGTGQPAPGTIWYLEVGFQTTLDPGKEGLYTGTETVAPIPDFAGGEPDAPPPPETSAASDQATQVLDAIRLAACQPNVGAYFNFLLADEPRLSGWQSGAYWADLTPKDSLPAFRAAIEAASSGTVDCDALKGGRPSADFMPPGAPPTLQGVAVQSPLSVSLTWGGAADDVGAVAYRVYRNGALLATVSSTTWTDPAVAAGTSYTYSVRALDAAGNLGEASSIAVAVDFVPPQPPSSLSAQWLGAPSRVQLSWSAAVDDVGVTAYEVSRDGVVLGQTSSTSFADTEIASATTYSYDVVAIDAGGNRSAPAAASVTTPGDVSAPSAPTGLRAKVGSGPRVKLSWAASSDDVGVTGYRVSRDGAVIATVGVTTYSDAAVVRSTRYRYAVSAVDAAGNESAPSAAVAVKTSR
jgi:fibronectin type 3 domain-containing protein